MKFREASTREEKKKMGKRRRTNRQEEKKGSGKRRHKACILEKTGKKFLSSEMMRDGRSRKKKAETP